MAATQGISKNGAATSHGGRPVIVLVCIVLRTWELDRVAQSVEQRTFNP